MSTKIIISCTFVALNALDSAHVTLGCTQRIAGRAVLVKPPEKPMKTLLLDAKSAINGFCDLRAWYYGKRLSRVCGNTSGASHVLCD